MNKAIRNISSLTVETSRYSVIILATKCTGRLKDFGLPSLLPITDKLNLIDKQIEYIKHILPNSEIILVTGFNADKLMNQTPDEVIKLENENFSEIETVRSLGLGLRAATRDHIVFIDGNIAFPKETLKSICNKSSLIINHYEHNNIKIGCCINDGMVENLYFDLPNKWSGIGIVSGSELELLKSFCWNRIKGNLFIFEALNYIISHGGKLIAKHITSKLLSIEVPQDINVARKILK